MSGFTPGPWVAERNTAYWLVRPVCNEWPRPADMPYTVADVCASAPGAPDGGLQEANARLIAAAPDLLAALKSAEESIVCFIGAHNYPKDSGAYDILNEVRAAIVKAEGAE